MLVINDVKMKLLKMKEKILEVSFDNRDKMLNEYQELASDIDTDYYNQIINEIKRTDYNRLTLEEQIKFFSEIEDDYNYLNQSQWLMRNTYEKYTNEEIKLTDISKILIDKIIERISDIQAYLMNIKNHNANEIELDRLNYQLITMDKDNENNKKIMLDIKNKLRSEMIKAEGRVYCTDGGMNTISIVSELSKYKVNLKEIIDDEDKLKELYELFNNEKKLQEETFEATINLPNRDEEICKQIENDMIISEYKFSLIELVYEICMSNSNKYDLFKDSLYKIAEIIERINSHLNKLDIRFYINPFERIRIDSQIHMMNKMRDIDKEIDNVKKTITYVNSMLENTVNRNQELLLKIENDVEILDNKRADNEDKGILIDLPVLEEKNDSELAVLEGNILEDKDEKLFKDIVLKNEFSDNQVVSLKGIGINFKVDRIKEKTDGVIKRVYNMFNDVEINDSDSLRIPELVLEPLEIKSEMVKGDDKNFVDMVMPEIDNEELADLSTYKKSNGGSAVNGVVNNQNDNMVIFDSVISDDVVNNIFKDELVDKNIDGVMSNGMIDNDFGSNMNSDTNGNINNANNEDLFQEIVPFENTPLFFDRYDMNVFDNKEDEKLLDLTDVNDKNIGSNYNDNNNEYNGNSNNSNMGNQNIEQDVEQNALQDMEQDATGEDIHKIDNNDMMMPDAFWVTKNDTSNDMGTNKLSFDEQVAALMGTDNMEKTKKKVA